MSTTLVQDTPVARTERRFPQAQYRLTLPRLLRSESIKLVTLRSPWWSAALVACISLGIGTLFALSLVMQKDYAAEIPPNTLVTNAALMPTMFTVLLASIIGTMLVTGEYSTGMIRSTLTAAPDRLRSMVAKLITVAVFIFVISALTITATAVVAALIFAGGGFHMSFEEPLKTLAPFVCGPIYLAAIGMMGVGIGYLIRNGAGAIAAIVGIVFVLPIMPDLLAMIPGADWVLTFARGLPTNAGMEFMTGDADGSRLVGGLVLLGWVIVTNVLGALVLKSRDA